MRHDAIHRMIEGAAAVPALEIARYLEMREDYFERCLVLPDLSHCEIALLVCAYAADVPIKDLTSHDGRRSAVELIETRQKMMAFSRIVSIGAPKPNTWKGIARVFCRRSHSTVIHATQKYGAQIAAALGMFNEFGT